MSNSLKGKVAIITGAAGGIGHAAARRFLDAEASGVMLVDLEASRLEAAAASLESDRVAWTAADVSSEADARRMVEETVSRFGGVDVLFANAGIEGTAAPLLQQTLEDVQRVLSVNVLGPWLGIKHAAPEMARRGGGSVIITSSVAGVIGSAGLGPYVASKHATIGLMKSAAIELAGQGIRVNTLNPGPVDNRMMRSIEEQMNPGDGDAVKSGFEAMVPLGRYGTNEEMAELALFLASDASGYCTGSVFLADGGFTAG